MSWAERQKNAGYSPRPRRPRRPRRPLSTLILLVTLLPASAQAYPFELALAALAQRPDVPETVPILIATAEADALAQVRGIEVRSCHGDICTADVWLDEIDAAELRQRSVVAEVSRQRRPLLEHSLPLLGVTPELRDAGYGGEGVIVIVIDTGVDWRHPDFRNDRGETRIEYLIDLSHPPQRIHPEVEARARAAVWTRADIDGHLAADAEGVPPRIPVRERDTFGHGTHVASVAAGSHGVAPEASLIVVRASREEWPPVFEDADVLDSARLAFELAAELGRPAVLVLSLGGHEGPHDGTSLLEQGLSELVGPEQPGRALVVAAGNSGHCQDHAGGDPRGDTLVVDLDIPREDAGLEVVLEVWHGADADLEISVATPQGDVIGPAAVGEEAWRNTAAAWVRIAHAPRGADERNGDYMALVSVSPQITGPILPGLYRVIVTGRGRFDAYLSWSSPLQVHGAAALRSQLEPDGTLTVPGTAPELIVVGAGVSSSAWVDEAGRRWADDRYEVGRLTSYTGSGPTRSGELKPDVVAPGHAVVAAMGRDAEAGSEFSLFTPASPLLPDRYLVARPGDRAVMWGTSVAAPHAAGVVALLFQHVPTLTAEEVRTLLIASARTDGGADSRAWNPRWGFGEVDATRAVRLLEEGFGTDVSASQSAMGIVDDVLAPDACTVVTVIPKDAAGNPLGPGREVNLTTTVGPTTAVTDGGDGLYTSRYCTGSARLGSGVLITAVVDGVELERTAIVRIAEDRSRLGGWLTAAGGCHVTAVRAERAAWHRLFTGL